MADETKPVAPKKDESASTEPEATPTTPKHSSPDATDSEQPVVISAKPVDEAEDPDDVPTQKIIPVQTPNPQQAKRTTSNIRVARPERALTGAQDEAPWTLQQFFNGEIDLDVELSKRFPDMPLLSIIKFRTLGTTTGRKVATIASQDGDAALVIDVDAKTKQMQLSYTLGSMITLRFSMDELTDVDRSRWLELMRREQGGLAFLWGASRWAEDYLICIRRKYHSNIFAFSPHNFEAAVRITHKAMMELLDWMDAIWEEEPGDDEPPPMLTW